MYIHIKNGEWTHIPDNTEIDHSELFAQADLVIADSNFDKIIALFSAGVIERNELGDMLGLWNEGIDVPSDKFENPFTKKDE